MKMLENAREHRELSDLTFEAELEEQAETNRIAQEKLQAEETAVQQQKLVQGMDTDGQFSQGVKSKMPSKCKEDC